LCVCVEGSRMMYRRVAAVIIPENPLETRIIYIFFSMSRTSSSSWMSVLMACVRLASGGAGLSISSLLRAPLMVKPST